jgi:hypothetical protein
MKWNRSKSLKLSSFLTETLQPDTNVTERTDNSIILWNLLGKSITIAMIPWMVWVSFTVVKIQSEIAVLSTKTTDLPYEVRLLRDRLIRLEVKLDSGG